MKQYVILLVFLLLSATCIGENKKNEDLKESRTTLPRFLGNASFENGELQQESLNDYLNRKVIYPIESIKCFEQGTEVVEFIVTASGELTAFNVVNSVCPRLDKEVIQAIKTTVGKWIPGTVDGKAADIKQEVSVIFTLYTSKEYMKKVQRMAYKGNHLLYVQNKPEKALRYLNCAICLLPNDENLLAARSLCRYAKGDVNGAKSDWERIKVLAKRHNNAIVIDDIAAKAHELNGYEEMMQALNWKLQETANKD